jgi:hypothetical protein
MKITMLTAEQAAEGLGVTTWELGALLREEAASALASVVIDVRNGHGIDVSRARRLLKAAEACEGAWREVEHARAVPQ